MKKVSYFSELRAVSCVAIVFLHTFFMAANGFETTFTQNVVSMSVRNSLLWAVPCFVMISGALLLDPDKTLPIRKILKKYLRRVLLAILIFTLVFCIFDSLTRGEPRGAAVLKDWLLKVWTNGSWLHMWYLYMLVGLYLMLPLYRVVTKARKDDILRYALLILFIFQSVFPTITYFAGRSSGFYLLAYTVYPFYFFLGYALHSGKLRIPVPCAAVLFAAGTVLMIVLTYLGIRLQNDAFRSAVGSYAFSGVALQSAGLFVLFRSSGGMRAGLLKKILALLDRCSFGIYLMHVLFLQIFYRVLRWNPYASGGTGILVLTALAALACAWALTAALRKIPCADRLL